MPYTLGSITLPNPKSFSRSIIETSAQNVSIGGKLLKKVIRVKERYVLTFLNLTEAQAGSILSEYNLNMIRDFTVTEDNLSIGPTSVLIDVGSITLPRAGKSLRENFDLILSEVA